MPVVSQKDNMSEPAGSKGKDFVLSVLKLIVLYIYGFMKKYYIPGILLILFFIIIAGKLLTKSARIFVLIVLAFGLLHLIVKWLRLQS